MVLELFEERGIGFADLLVEKGAESGHGASASILTLDMQARVCGGNSLRGS